MSQGHANYVRRTNARQEFNQAIAELVEDSGAEVGLRRLRSLASDAGLGWPDAKLSKAEVVEVFRKYIGLPKQSAEGRARDILAAAQKVADEAARAASLAERQAALVRDLSKAATADVKAAKAEVKAAKAEAKELTKAAKTEAKELIKAAKTEAKELVSKAKAEAAAKK